MGEIGSKIFIKDYLSKTKEELSWETKNLKREKKFKFMWIKNGTIVIRKNENFKVLEINEEEDSQKLLSPPLAAARSVTVLVLASED